MLIDKIEIKAFKSLEHLILELGKINVFVGANGSGKSNILEGIGILSAAANGKVDDNALLTRGVRPGVQNLYKCAFPGVRSNHIEFAASSNAANEMKSASYKVSLFNPIVQGNYTWQFHTENLKYNNKKILGRSHHSSIKKDFSIGLAALKAADPDPCIDDRAFNILRYLQSYAIYAPATPILRGIMNESYSRPPLGIGGSHVADALAEFKKLIQTDKKNEGYYQTVVEDIETLIDWALSFGCASSETVPVSSSIPHSKNVVRFVDRFMKPSRNILSGYDSSEGALYILFHALLAVLPTAPRFYAVDNADHALNPRLCQALFGKLCNWILKSPQEKQIILTTHNPLALNGLPLLKNDVRLFTVSRSIQGKTLVRRVIWNQDLEDKRKSDCLTISDMWISGELGGMPNAL